MSLFALPLFRGMRDPVPSERNVGDTLGHGQVPAVTGSGNHAPNTQRAIRQSTQVPSNEKGHDLSSTTALHLSSISNNPNLAGAFIVDSGSVSGPITPRSKLRSPGLSSDDKMFSASDMTQEKTERVREGLERRRDMLLTQLSEVHADKKRWQLENGTVTPLSSASKDPTPTNEVPRLAQQPSGVLQILEGRIMELEFTLKSQQEGRTQLEQNLAQVNKEKVDREKQIEYLQRYLQEQRDEFLDRQNTIQNQIENWAQEFQELRNIVPLTGLVASAARSPLVTPLPSAHASRSPLVTDPPSGHTNDEHAQVAPRPPSPLRSPRVLPHAQRSPTVKVLSDYNEGRMPMLGTVDDESKDNVADLLGVGYQTVSQADQEEKRTVSAGARALQIISGPKTPPMTSIELTSIAERSVRSGHTRSALSHISFTVSSECDGARTSSALSAISSAMSDIPDIPLIQDLVLQSLDAQLQRVNQVNMSEINKLHSVASNQSLRADAERLRSQVSELQTQVHASKLQLEEERVRSASTEQLLKRQLDMAKEDLKCAYLNIETLKKQLDYAKEENLIGYSHIAAGVLLNTQSEAPDASIFVPCAEVAELVTALNVQSQAPDDPRSTHQVTRLPVEEQGKRSEIVPAVVRASPQSKVCEAKEKTVEFSASPVALLGKRTNEYKTTELIVAADHISQSMDLTSSKAIASNHRTEFAPRHTGTSDTQSQHAPATTSPANSSSANRPQKVPPLQLNALTKAKTATAEVERGREDSTSPIVNVRVRPAISISFDSDPLRRNHMNENAATLTNNTKFPSSSTTASHDESDKRIREGINVTRGPSPPVSASYHSTPCGSAASSLGLSGTASSISVFAHKETSKETPILSPKNLEKIQASPEASLAEHLEKLKQQQFGQNLDKIKIETEVALAEAAAIRGQNNVGSLSAREFSRRGSLSEHESSKARFESGFLSARGSVKDLSSLMNKAHQILQQTQPQQSGSENSSKLPPSRSEIFRQNHTIMNRNPISEAEVNRRSLVSEAFRDRGLLGYYPASGGVLRR